MELWCVLVGGESFDAFIVHIASNRYVDDLKNAIKCECEPIVTCAVYELQLYLAEKDDAWLTSASVTASTLRCTSVRICSKRSVSACATWRNTPTS